MLDLMDLEDVARELKISIHTVRAWGYQKRFPTIKLGRRVLVERAAIERFVHESIIEAREAR
jgi:excisionase family DNA binding protein